jgi:hypothetical protein
MLRALLLNQGTTGSPPYFTIALVVLGLLGLLLLAIGKLAQRGPSLGRLLLLVGVLAFILVIGALFI